MIRLPRATLFTLLFSAGIAAFAQTIAPVAPSESIQNLDNVKADLKAYYECTGTHGCYARDLDIQADRAIAFLEHRALHPREGEKLAIVLDIDETTLSNYEEMVAADFAYDNDKFNAWIDSAKAPGLPATQRIYEEAQHLGVSVFFVTGRTESQRAATEKNLRAQGFDNWQELILRQPTEEKSKAIVYKPAARAHIVAEGYTIILNVGDQWSDLRGMPSAEFSVKYPDPFYIIQ